VKSLIKGILILVTMVLIGCQPTHTVTDTIIVPSTTADTSMVVAVNDALHRDRHLVGLPIQAQVTDGVVVLNGYVKTIRQSDTAAMVVAKVAGVRTVQNNLIVRK
jgi:hyperosmotically inducible protein